MRLRVTVEPSRYRGYKGEPDYLELRVEIESPELPDGKLGLSTEVKTSEFESLFDVQWQRIYEVLKRQIGKHLVEKKEATKWAEVG